MRVGDDGGLRPGRLALRLTVRGLVQGVGFRAATQRRATQLNLRGWVRNRPDGSVEVVAVGPEEAVRMLKEWCHAGPRAARVQSVDVEPLDKEPAGAPGRFMITR